MTANLGGHPEQRYTRRCPGTCAFTAPARDDWDETPSMTHCANCGLPLERVSCPACGAPVLWEHVMTKAGPQLRRAPHCAYCGAETAVRERKMRTKPKAPKITKLPDGLFPADEELEARLRRKMGGEPPKG